MDKNCQECKNCDGCNRVFWFSKTFSENIWGGIKNVPEVLDYVYKAKKYPNECVFTSFVLYKSEIKKENILLQLEEHEQENLIFYVIKFYTTKENKLKNLEEWKASTVFDKIISMKAYKEKVDLIYSDHLYSKDILEISEEFYNYVHNYLKVRKGLSEEQLNIESDILSNTKCIDKQK